MATTHEELLNTIKIAIDQLANDQSVPQRQTLRELDQRFRNSNHIKQPYRA